MIQFEWDSKKAAVNLKKHGISFEEARSVFYDEFAVQFYDDYHSDDEDQFLKPSIMSVNFIKVAHNERRI